MFCTLKQAAETLRASEEQIHALVEQGILHEFRTGPHRLVKEAEVGALALLQRPRAPAPPQDAPQNPPPGPPRDPARPAGSPPGGRSKAGGCATTRRPHPRHTAPPPSRRRTAQKARDQIASRVPRTPDRNGDRGRRPEAVVRTQAPRSPGAAYVRTAVRPARRSLPALSVRQWFWMGLLQDRPTAIALLTGLVLLLLSALAAGLCFVIEGR